MKLSIGISPCPNDTFIFDAIYNNKIDCHDIEFDFYLQDIETLNNSALEEKYDICKVSIGAFLHLSKNYKLLKSGAAMGFGTGPLLVSKENFNIDDLKGKTIGIPGEYTTANMLLLLAMQKEYKTKEYIFSEIENAILSKEIAAGVIIHESRFTYEDKGLLKIMDLGAFWEETTGCPVPLGGIAINKRIPEDVALKAENLIRRSIEHAYKQKSYSNFITSNAREIEVSVLQKHIELYVNDYSIKIGNIGKGAIEKFFEVAFENKLIEKIPENIFV